MIVAVFVAVGLVMMILVVAPLASGPIMLLIVAGSFMASEHGLHLFIYVYDGQH